MIIKKKGTCTLTDVAITGDRNVIKKGAEKVLKCKDRIMEIQPMWNVEATVIPVIIGATGTNLTHSGRVTQICVFNTVKLGTSASSP